MSSANPYSASPQPMSDYRAQNSSRTLRMTRLDPLSVGKMLGALYVFLGALVGLFMAFAALIGSTSGSGNAGGIAVGLGMLIFMPVIYGVMGFVAGVISALLYNLVAKFVGGIEFDVEG